MVLQCTRLILSWYLPIHGATGQSRQGGGGGGEGGMCAKRLKFNLEDKQCPLHKRRRGGRGILSSQYESVKCVGWPSKGLLVQDLKVQPHETLDPHSYRKIS